MEKKESNVAQEAPGDQMKDFSSTVKIAPGEYNEKDDLYDPFMHRDKKNAYSDFGALLHLLKASLGTGILAMPNAMKNGGLLFGTVGTLVIGFVCAHTIHILVRSSQVLCRRTKMPKMSYAETVHAAFLYGPKPVRPYANFTKTFINAGLCASYIGACCVYIVFVSTSTKQIADYYSGYELSVRSYILLLTPAFVLLGQIRTLKFLVPLSAIANGCMLVGFTITLYYLFQDIQPISSVSLIAPISELPKFFATVIFAIEGIGVVMPVENSMKRPQHFLGCPSVLNVTMTIVVSLYAVIGVFGYLKYGENTLGSVTLNLNGEEIPAQIVKILITIAVLFTYGLGYFVSLDIVWNWMKGKISHKYTTISGSLMRLLMVLFTVCVAILVPQLEPFISLVGAIFFSSLGIGVPAIVETVSCWDGHLGFGKWRLWKNAVLLLFSVLALIFGTWVFAFEVSMTVLLDPDLINTGNPLRATFLLLVTSIANRNLKFYKSQLLLSTFYRVKCLTNRIFR